MKPAVWLVLAWAIAPVADLDHAVQRAVMDARTPGWERAARVATDVGKPATVLGLLLGVAAFTGSAGPATARLALLALVPTNLVVEGTKRLTDRTRPDGEHKPSNASFPSSHAANAFALAAVLARRWRRAAVLLFLVAAAVAVSRMVLNRHFLSDTVVGSAVGLVCAELVMRWRARSVAVSPG